MTPLDLIRIGFVSGLSVWGLGFLCFGLYGLAYCLSRWRKSRDYTARAEALRHIGAGGAILAAALLAAASV